MCPQPALQSLQIPPQPNPAWFALKVRARSETLVSQLLQQKGFDSFAPTFHDCRIYKDRVKQVEAALFPGYIFCRFHAHETLPIVTTPAVQLIVSTGTQPAAISDFEIENLRLTAATGLARPFPYLREGHKVRVHFGPLTGVEGYLVARKGAQRLVIAADLLQRAIAIEVDLDQVAPLPH
jgi:transcription antitermination factor NusG